MRDASDRVTTKVIMDAPERVQASLDSRVNLKESLIRNEKFLKDLELSKARLRTLAAYTPTEEELQQVASTYRKRLQKKSDS
ncbi:PREDICTED: uncharacterized protein LOC106788248 [Polistes canadensis]|uniref:uncharacterized protein LOC106788248 n=1 Tax=Polistes canadensis TaxID=91411 RepID=UPI000718DAF8|nr:PREDICTED: uncharacterized protein LOC106788248 [Polistes canadensis]